MIAEDMEPLEFQADIIAKAIADRLSERSGPTPLAVDHDLVDEIAQAIREELARDSELGTEPSPSGAVLQADHVDVSIFAEEGVDYEQ